MKPHLPGLNRLKLGSFVSTQRCVMNMLSYSTTNRRAAVADMCCLQKTDMTGCVVGEESEFFMLKLMLNKLLLLLREMETCRFYRKQELLSNLQNNDFCCERIITLLSFWSQGSHRWSHRNPEQLSQVRSRVMIQPSGSETGQKFF